MVSILIVEDDELIRLSLVSLLSRFGEITATSTFVEGSSLLEKNNYDICFFDLDLEEQLAGLRLLKVVRSRLTYKVILTARDEEETVRRAYESGADDYLVKPIGLDEVTTIFSSYEIWKNGEAKLEEFFQKTFLTQDEVTKKRIESLLHHAASMIPLFIGGASGTGKTLLAKLVHQLSKRKHFVHINCSEFTETLLESELFGHKKGAFTGATSDVKGKLELAHEGTLFLDEVATMPISLQKKLLRVIEEKTFYPLGSGEEVRSNFRIISATREPLKEMISDGRFREDLYYRFVAAEIQIPSLYDRKIDILFQLDHFLDQQKRKMVVTDEAKKEIAAYSWPGNTRELKQFVELMAGTQKKIIDVDDFSFTKNIKTEERSTHFEEAIKMGLPLYIQKIEEEVMNEAIARFHGKVRVITKELKIAANSYYRINQGKKNEN